MSRKLRKALIIIFTALLILGGTTLAVLYYMGDRIVEEAIRNEISLENSKSGQATQSNDSSETGSDETSGTDNAAGSQSNSGTTATDAQQQADGLKPSPAAELASDKVAGAVGKNTGKKKASKKKSAVIAETKIAEIKNEVTAEDKISAAALILKRLTPGDINELKNMFADGLSEEEKEKAKELAYSKFTKEEITEIKEMYAKYMY